MLRDEPGPGKSLQSLKPWPPSSSSALQDLSRRCDLVNRPPDAPQWIYLFLNVWSQSTIPFGHTCGNQVTGNVPSTMNPKGCRILEALAHFEASFLS
ncbi:hypothetical protein DPEC_G00298830 [Dallia pectoralis]|uniref:Uncharacterized protein n=1 Tax=Dallia pectoralis TaxID=75939 RepID=A0ACC2FFY7_DALPE|nr:hypothetical protein DPEC_G00298830 [Dallia pectoralis]